MDLSDWSILAHELSASLSTKFASISLKNVITWHEPGEGLMVHTDQGIHYQHSSWCQLLVSNAFEQGLEERVPRTHRVIRRLYDTYGFPVGSEILIGCELQ